MVNEESILEAKHYFSFFALITNEAMNVVTALELYRNKDIVEKTFGNLNERLNMCRTLFSSEQSLDGKLFVQFVVLI
jgi:transposase